MSRTKFVPPTSLDEAELRHADLVKQAQNIDFQLGQERETHDPEWRNRATYAKQMISADARDLKLWMKAQRRMTHALTTGIGAKHSNPHVLMLSRAYRVLRQLACSFEFDAAEQAEVDALQDYLQRCADPEVKL